MWDQVFVIATVVGTVATLPLLIEFLAERRKRKERLALSIEVEDVEDLHPRVAGFDALLADNADLIDRARTPEPYKGITLGNEILILGPSQYGKRSLAQRIARDAEFDQLITVYNPRNKDALTKAKSLIAGIGSEKVMLLIPRIDLVFEREDEDLLAELDALIETTTHQSNVLVVGTAVWLEFDSELDNLFGTKLVLPGTPKSEQERKPLSEEARAVLADVVRYYMQDAVKAGFRFVGLGPEEVITFLLAHVGNAAEVEDVIALARTRAIHARRMHSTPTLDITPDVLQTAVDRVIVNIGSGEERRWKMRAE